MAILICTSKIKIKSIYYHHLIEKKDRTPKYPKVVNELRSTEKVNQNA